MRKKAGIAIIWLLSFVCAYFVGRHNAEKWCMTRPESQAHLVKGMHFVGKCFIYPGNESVVYSHDHFNFDGARPCVISPDDALAVTQNEDDEPRYEQ